MDFPWELLLDTLAPREEYFHFGLRRRCQSDIKPGKNQAG
jgi:hypothetical protein